MDTPLPNVFWRPASSLLQSLCRQRSYALWWGANGFDAVLAELAQDYAGRGIQLEQTGTRFAFRTAPDLTSHLSVEREEERKLSKAALETLAIIAYHQPATRGDIEDLRGVAVARGTLDVLLEHEWIAPKGRRDTPGRPIEWVTTPQFLDHFALEAQMPCQGCMNCAALAC